MHWKCMHFSFVVNELSDHHHHLVTGTSDAEKKMKGLTSHENWSEARSMHVNSAVLVYFIMWIQLAEVIGQCWQSTWGMFIDKRTYVRACPCSPIPELVCDRFASKEGIVCRFSKSGYKTVINKMLIDLWRYNNKYSFYTKLFFALFGHHIIHHLLRRHQYYQLTKSFYVNGKL